MDVGFGLYEPFSYFPGSISWQQGTHDKGAILLLVASVKKHQLAIFLCGADGDMPSGIIRGNLNFSSNSHRSRFDRTVDNSHVVGSRSRE